MTASISHRQPEIHDDTPTVVRPVDQPAIETIHLTKFYGRQRGIEDLNLTVRQGEVFGFLGPNGAGKTTTIRLLLDLIRPTAGRARIRGLDCRRDGIRVRRQVGYLPGEYRLYENLNGRQLLAYLDGLHGGPEPASLHALAARFGADLDRPIRTLSHGNKQKLALIQAFMHQAPILILDEPTTGLDPLIQQEFFGLLGEARAAGRTVFLSSHNLTEVERVCDRVASVREGRLAAIDEITALRGRALRIVKLTCARPPEQNVFERVRGVSDLRIDGAILECSIQGNLGPLVAAAAPYEIVDILSREPSLEEFFLALYGEKGGGGDR
jgi:ABC-2 type transport system ATP-binding protein